jgi:uncharacterized protein YndB with AHSA1/START domain
VSVTTNEQLTGSGVPASAMGTDGAMPRNSIEIAGSPTDVFAVLDDATAYPRWVVGARRIRRVDDSWPAEGSRFHHALGVPGAELHDSSKVIRRDPPHHLELEVRFRPTGVARVELEVTPAPAGSTVSISERPLAGPFAWLPQVVSDPVLHLRNAWSLRRLRSEVERRTRSAP